MSCYRVNRQSQMVKGCWCNPAILKITVLWKIFLEWTWILQYMLETSFSSFITKKNKKTTKKKQKNGEILIFKTFLAKNSISVYISLKWSDTVHVTDISRKNKKMLCCPPRPVGNLVNLGQDFFNEKFWSFSWYLLVSSWKKSLVLQLYILWA